MIVYLIQNKINKKCYIGQTVRSLQARWYQHCKISGCPALKASIDLHSPENFFVYVIKECQTIENLNFWEEVFIKHYDSLAPKGYNLSTGGGNARHTPETKAKISKGNLGRPRSDEERRKVSEFHKGKTLSEAHKAALHGSRRGKPMSDEHKKNIATALKGKRKSKEHKLALSKAKKKKKDS